MFAILAILTMMAAGCGPAPAPAPAATAPTAYIDSISPAQASLGQTVTFAGHGTDEDGTVVAYRWKSSLAGDLSTTASFQTSSLSAGQHSIYLVVQDNNGNWSQEALGTVTVSGSAPAPGGAASLPVISSFNATPGSIKSGVSSTLGWNVTGATTVSIDHAIGSVGTTGTRAVAPAMTTTYTLTATNQAGSATATTQVIVSGATGTTTPTPNLPVISSFNASPASITSGFPSTLSWNVSGATTVSIDHAIGNVGTTGTTEVRPVTTTTYTLTATNSAGSVTKAVQVTTGAPMTGYRKAILDYEIAESGTVGSDGYLDPFQTVLAGDFPDDTIARGYVSFDISSLAGSDVTSAKLTFNEHSSIGDPFGNSLLGLSEVWYGPRALIPSDYYLPTLNNLTPSNTGTGSIDVTQFVEQAVVNRQDRFQVRFRFPFDTNYDGQADNIWLNPVTLEVTYR